MRRLLKHNQLKPLNLAAGPSSSVGDNAELASLISQSNNS